MVISLTHQRLCLISPSRSRLYPNQHHRHTEFLSLDNALAHVFISAHQEDGTDGTVAWKNNEVAHDARIHTLLSSMHHPAKPKLEPALVRKCIVLRRWKRVYSRIVPVSTEVFLSGVLLTQVRESGCNLDWIKQQVAAYRGAVAEISCGCKKVPRVDENNEAIHGR